MDIENVIHEPELISAYHKEYLSLINYYHNTIRPSIFVKYFNINALQSTNLEQLDSTFDQYNNSEIRFDVYEFTPAFFTQTINNRVDNVEDLDGIRVDGTSSITLYTIDRPNFGDIVAFYPPVMSGELFRVVSVSSPVNVLYSDPSATWFELDLEYAPIKDTSVLNKENYYVYDLTLEQNITKNKYVSRLKNINKICSLLDKIHGYFDEFHEMYLVSRIVPVVINELVMNIKRNTNNQKYNRIYDKYKTPYGYIFKHNYNQTFEDLKIDDNSTRIEIDCIDVDTGEFIDPYIWNIFESDKTEMDNLLRTGFELHKLLK